ncbi:LPXTG cell wall anchor domain-containing protein, partial [Streptomyces sp. NPDC048295]|uniref:LPXTG cell wall anchor domain-containing protein n=1 Tax=Streptomyces sp. NPDC048295 TaxID=3154617 RepID=UPI00343D0737
PDCPPNHHHTSWHHTSWHHKPVHHKPAHHKPPQLAHTGADANLGMAGGAAAAMVLGGTLLVRRTRTAKD